VTDNDGATATDALTVIVQTPAQALQALRTFIQGLAINGGVKSSLLSKIDAALASLAKGRGASADNQLAALVNQVQAQCGGQIPSDDASTIWTLLAPIRSAIQAGTLAVDGEFKLGEAYCYPNPARTVEASAHIEAGLADSLDMRLYDAAGTQIHEATLQSPPSLLDGRYTFESRLPALGSGVYTAVAVAKKSGSKPLRTTFKCAIVR